MDANTGTRNPFGSGNGGRSVGTGVMLICVTVLPSISRITVPAGRRNSNPGINGFVMTTSSVVGDVMLTAWAISNRGIQIVYPRTFVLPDSTFTPTLKVP